MTEYIICGLCGFRGLEVGSTICILCNNDKDAKKNKKAKKYIEQITEPPKDTNFEEECVGLYEKYVCKSNKYNLPNHPSVLMESSLLSAIPVNVDENQNLKCVNNNLSSIQIETIGMIISSYGKYYQDIHYGKTRCGFYLGDGTGCGKGRVISGVINELKLTNNIQKAVWFSVSQDLEKDSQRDLNDVMCNMETMNLLNKSYKNNGVMFSTYNTIVKHKRYCDLCDWLGDDYEGLFVFDESHKAKQCLDKNKSKTAEKIIELQNKYPKARVLYVSATGCSQVEHMGYMVRLNLWGNDTLHEDFKNFVDVTNHGGDFANEMVAMHLKKSGLYISRTLSYKKVTTGVTLIKTSEYKELYNNSIKIIDAIRASGLIDGKIKMMFGSAMLRFFRSLILTFKIEKTIKMITQCLEDNMSVVVTTQSTWETHQNINVDEFDAPKTTLLKFINHIKDINEEDEDVQEKCDNLIEKIEEIRIGSKLNVIDSIIEKFGEDQVAEITGRKKYTINNELVQRKTSNLEEKDLFINDKKRICVISEAGSVGISLHDVTKKYRRFHIILELPWSAEQFVQQCGRTHRSGQKSAPHYQIVITDLPSESRFLSIIMKRLRTLGALTNGNRFIKTDMFELGQDYESVEGEMAMNSILNNEMLSANLMELFHKCNKVSRFFNRMMMLNIETQHTLFEMFHKEYLKYSNDVQRKNTKQQIHDVLISNIINVQNEKLNNTMNLTTLTVSSTPTYYENIKSGTRLINKQNSLAVAVKLHKDSDLYRLYQCNKIKEPIVSISYIENEFTKYDKSYDEFKRTWNKCIEQRTEKILLVTGDLYEIRMRFNKHNGVKNSKLKKVSTANQTIMGFHIGDKMKNVVKQIIK